jgi:eukaryotic-like serine/threonine-protein kinase
VLIGGRLGAYEILGKLGEGGMGEVYRARDARLDRNVALKILPQSFAADPDRVMRFEREAKTLAALNHPHIAGIYGVEEANGTRALVMELVEGPTLAERLADGPVALDEALAMARQIAAALEAAHDAGIIHRDLKPANIKVRADGTVKVLDFGLAKALEPHTPAGLPANSPTFTSPAQTYAGVILGTAGYMSPEQAKGKPVDKRADIWAFGVVLYEMLTGRTLFAGETVTETLAEVLKRDVDLSALPRETPAAVRRVIARCLERDPRRRWRDIGDAALDLESAEIVDTTAPPSRRRGLLWGIPLAALAAAVAVLATWALTRPRPETPIVIRAEYQLPAAVRVALQRPQIAVSPDGRFAAVARGGVVSGQVNLRRVDQADWTPIPGSDDASGVFFSPDSQWLGFWTSQNLYKVSLAGGAPVLIHRLDFTQFGGPESAMWADDGHIYYADLLSGIYALPETGGAPRLIVRGSNVSTPLVPRNSRMLLYSRAMPQVRLTEVILRPLDGGEEIALVPGSAAKYLADGTLLFMRDDAIMAAHLDLRARRLGPPRPVLQGVSTLGLSAQYSVSDHGTLVYMPGGATFTPEAVLRRIGRDGSAAPLPGEPRQYSDTRLSPDGRRLAVHLSDEQNDVWTSDVSRGTLTRLSFGAGEDETPAWSPDGRWLAYSGACEDDALRCVYRRLADGSDQARVLWQGNEHVHVNDWSPDGGTLVLDVVHAERRSDLMLLSADGGELRPYLATTFAEVGGRLSPDGKWLAYSSSESGRQEIYVQSFPAPGGKVRVSTGGGTQPVWSRDGRELFYRSAEQLMAVKVSFDEGVSVGTPVALFQDAFLRPQGEGHTTYDVFPDGSFLFLEGTQRAADAPTVVAIFNWASDVARALATGRP